MRDLLFLHRELRVIFQPRPQGAFPWLWGWTMAPTSYPFFTFLDLDFLRFIDDRILVNVVNILFYFSVMRDSL